MQYENIPHKRDNESYDVLKKISNTTDSNLVAKQIMLKIPQSLKGKLYKLSCFYLITPGCSEQRGKNFK